MLDKRIKTMLDDLNNLYDLAYKELKTQVAYIIKKNLKDSKMIESTLDQLLNIPTDKCYLLFIKLCNYVATFDQSMADDYLTIYDELYGNHDNEAKKKSH